MKVGRNGRQPCALVAGGAGFIGSHLCDALLERGVAVICADSFLTGRIENVAPLANHPHFRLVEQDVLHPIETEARVDFIFNLACPASPPHYQADPVHTLMTSVQGTYNLLQLAEWHDARYLQASTSEVYGDPLEHPQRETYWGHVNPIGPRACYDEGKRAAEALCFDMLRAGRADVRVARIFNTYGPRMRPDDGRIISNFIVQALRGEPLTIYGSGEQTRSFCYVSDLVAGLLALMEADPNPGQPVNLGNPVEFAISDLVGMIAHHIPGAGATVQLPLPADDPQRRRPDIDRARHLLGWEPKIPLSKGLPMTISWFAHELDRHREQLSRLAARPMPVHVSN